MNAWKRSASEGDIQSAICQLLTLKRNPFSVTDSSLYFDGGRPRRKVKASGWPDIAACLPGGRLLAIEVKSARGKLRPAQQVVLERLREAGALVVIARDVNDVIAVLGSQS